MLMKTAGRKACRFFAFRHEKSAVRVRCGVIFFSWLQVMLTVLPTAIDCRKELP
ncbi:hypothetical protein [Amphibiibacter pelophylacis]|uniref:Uncharacterized protein n=1 Tax=Amphibiibacter pelophylacis TaxID=1799477 RepID=A0ACC6P2C6_9BURK